ncbi:barstar family protein [Streptomyces yerevanensis]|uniref:barstar family protein n=1 Tax=Streptomyces yerevanensis TaxID=66378 RepID=UPI000998220A|nr:barstar family protein [Streptomyces yerevanensis]
MTSFDITGTSEPWVVFVPQGVAEVHRQLSSFEANGGRIHHFDSRDLMAEQGIYRSFAEVLQFPDYFGRNWDALVDCLDDLCGAVTGGVGIVGVIHDADRLLEAEHFPLFVSVLCQGADRANSAVDLDGFPLDRPAIAEHFILEFREFDREKVALRVGQPDLTVTTGDRFVAAALNPDEWH